MELTSTPFDASSTAGEVLDGVDLSGRRAVVTGGASGIGTETARALAAAGALVALAVRDAEAAGPVAEPAASYDGQRGARRHEISTSGETICSGDRHSAVSGQIRCLALVSA